MTVIAGAYCIDPDGEVPKTLRDGFRTNLRTVKDGLGHWSTFDRKRVFLIKWDSGAFNEAAWAVSVDESLSTLIGDPLLTSSGERLTRDRQLIQLVGSDGKLRADELAQTRGAFSIARFDAKSQTLSLATDMLGLRPVYYTLQSGVFIFASALRVLESMIGVQKKLSMTGMVELNVFAFPLAERTPYEGICVLRECETLTVTEAGTELSVYYDWAAVTSTPDQAATSAEALFAEFQEAIRIRGEGDRKTYAFLSGGMDSRAIVGCLLMGGLRVEALNFSPDASQDQAYARSFAEAAGLQCQLHCLTRNDDPNFSLLAFDAKTKLEKSARIAVDRPAFIWSGDGGSVGLGHVYMDEIMLDHAEKGDINAAVNHFLATNRLTLPAKVLSRDAARELPEIVFTNALAEVHRYPRADLGRRLYFFLLFNDQRRHLFKHFESIDKHGLEFLLPFYDVKFLKMVADTPSRWGVLHKLYALWFEHLPAYARSTPWQTYPGHVACPVAGDKSLSYQWASREQPYQVSFRSRVPQARTLLREAFDPGLSHIFSRARICLVAFMHLTGVGEYGYILKVLQRFRDRGAYVKPTQGQNTGELG